jgi:hypothetical protein
VKKHLTSQNVCDILSKCQASGVKELRFQDLHVTFESKLRNDKDLDNPPREGGGNSTIETQDLLAQEELNFKDEQLATLQLTDPLHYEELLSQKELIDP